jgi:hypothetical protein
VINLGGKGIQGGSKYKCDVEDDNFLTYSTFPRIFWVQITIELYCWFKKKKYKIDYLDTSILNQNCYFRLIFYYIKSIAKMIITAKEGGRAPRHAPKSITRRTSG